MIYEDSIVFDQYFVEQRKFKRFKMAEGIVVLFSHKDLYLPTDISGGGLAVKSRGDNSQVVPAQWAIDILLKGERFHAHIPLKLAWKKDVHHAYFPILFGFQFDDLTESNRSKVEYLIQLHQEFASQYTQPHLCGSA